MKKSTATKFLPLVLAVLLAVLSPLFVFMVGCASLEPETPRRPDPRISVPAGHEQAFRLFAKGVQIYSWSGTNWIFRGPEATLFDAKKAIVGKHYKDSTGPIWEGIDGSRVVGKVVTNAPAFDTNAIPQLLLKAESASGQGRFADVTYIQRVGTVGGKAPSNPSSNVGQETRSEYSAEYVFYRKMK